MLYFMDRAQEIENIEWLPHPKFDGAFLKHLILGADNDNHASCHLVRINPGCQLNDHIHENQWEYHHVIDGEARGYLEGKEMAYKPGVIAVIPQGKVHKVVAGESGLVLLATFLPALM
jgi:quercetin dioxygenase-like cupin family protein